MSKVDVKSTPSTEDRSLPVFAEVEELMERIRERAYGLFRERGGDEGRDLDDWLRAEREFCWPAAELEEEDDEFELKVALAGFGPNNITVTASPRELIVKAFRETGSENTAEEGKEEADIRWSTFRSNNVYRRIELPTPIDVSKVKAKLENGLLEIEAPKAEETAETGQRIEVAGGD